MWDRDRTEDGDGWHLRVAVIDDNPIVLSLMREMLERAGREVMTFASPEAALTALTTANFDVVLCDIHMPGMNGIEFYRHVQSNNPAYNDRVIFLTGDRFTPEMDRFLTSTGCSCLCKPFRRTDLEKIIGRIMARSAVQEEPYRWRKAA